MQHNEGWLALRLAGNAWQLNLDRDLAGLYRAVSDWHWDLVVDTNAYMGILLDCSGY